MEILPQSIPDLLVLKPKRFKDCRGYFTESWSRRTLLAHGMDFDFKQDNISHSSQPGTVRGLHFQEGPAAQVKLVSVLQGAILDVAVDIRHGSPTYGRHVAVELSEENGSQALVPRGFAHGFCTLRPDTVIMYKVDNFYDAAHEVGLAWNDPDLGISWPSFAGSSISEKDTLNPALSALPVYFKLGAG